MLSQRFAAACCSLLLQKRGLKAMWFLLPSHGEAATDALDEAATVQSDSLASRCEVSLRITASGTGG